MIAEPVARASAAPTVSGKDIDPVDQHRWPALQGPHNAQNAVCAIAVCRVLGLNDEAIERGLAAFKSLPHRMELVGEVAGVLFVNDSKATNAASTAPALAAYPRGSTGFHWVAGGQDRRWARCLPTGSGMSAQAYTDRRSDGDVCGLPEIGEHAGRTLGHARRRGRVRRRRMRSRATSCCCRPPARRSTSSRIMSSAAMQFRATCAGAWGMSGGMDNMDATTERPVIATTRTVKRRGPRLSRADRTPLGLWFWEIDRVLLLLVSMLVGDRAGRGRGGVAGRRSAIRRPAVRGALLFLSPGDVDRSSGCR